MNPESKSSAPLTQSASPVRARSALQPGAVVDGRYRVKRTFFEGPHAVHYEAEHLQTGRRVAIKALPNVEDAARLTQEARALAKLSSPAVLQVLDVIAKGELRGLVTELPMGRTLREVLEEGSPMTCEFACNLAEQVAEAMQEAHDQGLIHLELKPDNLVVLGSSSGSPSALSRIKIREIGAARDPGLLRKAPLTPHGEKVATPYYMALEDLTGTAEPGPESDVYALSVLLYEALGGSRPFEAESLSALIGAVGGVEPTPLTTLRPDLPQAVSDVIMRGLRRKRTDRPPSMAAFGEALLPYADPAFTLWLRDEGAADVQPSIESAPSVQSAERARTGSSEGSLQVAPSPQSASGARIVADRDTPTEMYRAAVHAPRPEDKTAILDLASLQGPESREPTPPGEISMIESRAPSISPNSPDLVRFPPEVLQTMALPPDTFDYIRTTSSELARVALPGSSAPNDLATETSRRTVGPFDELFMLYRRTLRRAVFSFRRASDPEQTVLVAGAAGLAGALVVLGVYSIVG